MTPHLKGGLCAAVLVLASGLSAQRARAFGPEDFKIEVQLDRLPAISQGNTGTCWCFATTSFLETEVKRIKGEQVDLSEMYGVYEAWREKAETFVRLEGHAQLGQGGLSHDLIAMARKYGVEPQSAYTGLREGQRGYDHGELEKVIQTVMPLFANDKHPGGEWRDAVRGVLDAYMGHPPETFEVDGRTVTPQQYAREVLQLPLDDYVELMSFQTQGFGHKTQLLVPDNWMRDGNYWNMPVADLVANVDHALRAGFSVAIDADVSENTNDQAHALFRLSPQMEKHEITDDLRQMQFDSKETTDDHLMHIVGLATDPDGGTWYLLKNSWGRGGPFEGHWMMSRAYLSLKTLAVMIHKDGLTEATRKQFGVAAK
ncbi:MAG: C1 family peptidase [Planctomycetota bacterium]